MDSLSIITGQTTDDRATVIGTISLINNTIYNLSIKGIGVGAVSSPAEYASYTGTPPGCATPITITADNIGLIGNSIILDFDGIKTITQIIAAYNASYPTKTCTLTGNGSQIINNKEKIQLSGGVNEARPYAAINVVGSVKNEEGVVNINGVVVSSLFDDYTGCVLTIQAGTGSNLNILATGKAATAINWSAKVEWNDISFA